MKTKRFVLTRWLASLNLIVSLLVTLLAVVNSAQAAETVILTTVATGGDLLTAGNWSAGLPSSTVTATFTNTATRTYNLSAGTEWLGIVKRDTAFATTITNTANTLTLDAGGIDMSLARQNLTLTLGEVTLNAVQTWNVTNTRTLTITAPVSGAFPLTKDGGGGLTLNSTNTYTGDTTISDGTLTIGGAGQLGSGTYSGNIANNGAFKYASSAAQTLSGIISGSGSVTNSGTATLIFSGNNTFSGGVTVTAGSISATDDHGFGTGTVTFNGGNWTPIGTTHIYTNPIVFAANSSGNLLSTKTVLAGPISGPGNLTQNGFAAGWLTLSNDNSGWTGRYIMNGQTRLRLAHPKALGAGAYLTFSDNLSSMGTLESLVDISGGSGVTNNIHLGTSGAAIAIPSAYPEILTTADLQLSGVISGPAGIGFQKTGAGTLTLSGANTYSGGTVISSTGPLALGHTNALGTGTLTNSFTNGKLAAAADLSAGNGVTNNIVMNNAFYVDTANNNLKLSGNLTSVGSQTMVKQGAGSLTFAGNVSGLGTYRTEEGETVMASGSAITTTSQFNTGTVANKQASLTIQAGANVTAQLYMIGFGTSTTGIVNQAGGTVSAAGNTRVGAGTGAYGRYNFDGGTLTASGDLYAGYANSSLGEFNMTGGQLNVPTTKMVLGRDGAATNSSGYYWQSGGIATINTLVMAGNNTSSQTNTGYLMISNAVFVATNFTSLAAGGSCTGILNFAQDSQVTLPAFPTARGAGSYTELTFDGGTLSNRVASTSYLQGLDHCYLTTNGATFNVGGDITVAQALENESGQAGKLTKLGSGSLTLSSTNTYTGVTTISNGTVQFSKQGSLYNNTPASWTAANLVVESNGCAAFVLGGTGEFTTANIDTLKALGTASGGFKNGSFIGLNPTTTPDYFGYMFQYSSSIANPNGGANQLGLVKTGSKYLHLTGANTYTGPTKIIGNNGAVVIDNDSKLGTPPGSPTPAQLVLDGAGLAAMSSFTLNANRGIWLGTNAGAGGAIVLVDVFGSPTLTYGGVIDGPGSLSVQNFAGGSSTTLILTGANTYSGATQIAAGTLALSGSGSISNSFAIQIVGGATFKVSGLNSTFTLGGSQTLANSASATGFINGNLNTGSGTVYMTYASGTPSFSIANGTLMLSSGTVFNINNTGAALTAGNYKVISKGTAGAVAGTMPAVTVSGGGIDSGLNASLAIVSGELYLVVQSVVIATTPTNIVFSVSSSNLSLTWPGSHLGWLAQSNAVDLADTNYWFNIPGSDAVTNLDITIDPSLTNVFYRLKMP